MTWKDLLQTGSETLVSPWVGGRSLRSGSRHWRIEGPLPPEQGWVEFKLQARSARFNRMCEAATEQLRYRETGYLVGDRVVHASVRAVTQLTPAKVLEVSERVYLLDAGLDRFTRVSAGRVSEDGPLIFIQQEMPLGPEGEVLNVFLDSKETITDIPEVTPALSVAFYLESWQKAEAIKRRREVEERLRAEEEARQLQARRQEMVEKLGDAAGRRVMAQHDFEAAAKAALAISGAEYLAHRASYQRNEMVVQFRLDRRRFECTCDSRTLQIIDAGICLTAHDDDEFEEGTKGDSFFSLESLPSVIREADREGKLVVFRHVN